MSIAERLIHAFAASPAGATMTRAEIESLVRQALAGLDDEPELDRARARLRTSRAPAPAR